MDISCGLIITHQNKILLGHVTHKNFWDIPKGHMEENETFLDCCLREVKEETNLDLYSIRDKFNDLGLFKFTKNKNLYLFRYDNNSFFDINELKCVSTFEENNKEYFEIDDFKYINFEDIYKFSNNKLGLLLCKILNIPLKFEQKEEIRRTICYILRHNLPENNNKKISPWLQKKQLYKMCIEVNPVLSNFSLNDLLDIIINDKSNRFTIKDNYIKANYGHSQNIYEDKRQEFIPNDVLYHLTFSNYINNILQEGLKPMTRKYVFVAINIEKAEEYNKKLKKIRQTQKDNTITPVLLEIDGKLAYKEGIKFFTEKDNIICTKYIPSKYISIKKSEFININKTEYLKLIDIYNQK